MLSPTKVQNFYHITNQLVIKFLNIWRHSLYYELIKISDIKDRKGGQKFVESIEDYLYAADEEEYLVDESELQLTDMLHEYTING